MDGAPMPRQAKGCEACSGTGYQGLIAIFEALRCSGEIEQAVEQQQRPEKIETISVDDGMVPLRLSAKLAVARGIAALKDAMRLIAE
jgi:type II secretory ATPase GspE/PulE/Tfp pilus assembly ATPase PilB-like protein